MEEVVQIEELHDFTPGEGDSIRSLLKQLSQDSVLSDEDLKEILASDATHLFVARLGEKKEIVGMNLLVVVKILDRKKGTLEDLVVDNNHRGKGIGKKLLLHAVDEAKRLGVKTIDFTSRPEREVANSLYQSLGFEKRDTNVYRVTFD